MKKVVKELLFFILFLAVILLMIGSLLYEYIPNEVISGVTKYEQSSGTKKILSQIQTDDSADDIDEEKSEEKDNAEKKDSQKDQTEGANVLTSYEVASDNVAEYSNSNNEYETGKNYPFYDYTKAMDEEKESDTTKSTSGSSSEKTKNTTSSSENTKNTSKDSGKSKLNTANTTNTTNTTEATYNTTTRTYTYNSSNKSTTSTNTNKSVTDNLRDTSDSTKTQK